jgi:HPt (histidine-containing phosphotransfer) domain-containing protein
MQSGKQMTLRPILTPCEVEGAGPHQHSSSQGTRLTAAANHWPGRSRQQIGRLSRHATWINRVSTETASVPAIDMSAITQLADNDDMGEQFIAEIIKVFLADLGERVHKIGLQMSQNDRAGVAATAHAIKGSCGHFGAANLVELSRVLEDRARREPTGDLQMAIDSMIGETKRVRAALEAFQRDQPAPL